MTDKRMKLIGDIHQKYKQADKNGAFISLVFKKANFARYVLSQEAYLQFKDNIKNESPDKKKAERYRYEFLYHLTKLKDR